MTTPSWLFLVLRFALYAGAGVAFVLGAIDQGGLDALTNWVDGLAVGGLSAAAVASGAQALKGRPRKAAEPAG